MSSDPNLTAVNFDPRVDSCQLRPYILTCVGAAVGLSEEVDNTVVNSSGQGSPRLDIEGLDPGNEWVGMMLDDLGRSPAGFSAPKLPGRAVGMWQIKVDSCQPRPYSC